MSVQEYADMSVMPTVIVILMLVGSLIAGINSKYRNSMWKAAFSAICIILVFEMCIVVLPELAKTANTPNSIDLMRAYCMSMSSTAVTGLIIVGLVMSAGLCLNVLGKIAESTKEDE